MKNSLVLVSVALVVFEAAVLVSRLAVNASANSLNIPAIFSGLFVSGVLLTAFSDYGRKPRFRIDRARKAARKASTAISSETDTVSGWTYSTFSA